MVREHDERQIMKLHLDTAADALYLRLDDSVIVESDEVAPGMVLDYNEHNQVVGFEVIGHSNRTPRVEFNGVAFHTE